MAEENINIDYELITKHFAEEASAEESEAVLLWVNTSEKNRHTFAQLEMLWQQTGRIIPHEKAAVDVNSAWNRFKERSAGDIAERPSGKSRNLFFYFSRAAAVLIIGLVVYLIYQRNTGRSIGNIDLVASSEIVTDTLSDGSLISLNAWSQLSVPEKFRNDARLVSLKGEAFFNVTSNPKKPFIVQVDGVRVMVLGTSFRIKAYDSLSFIAVGVEEGKVKVMTPDASLILQTGESISISRASKKTDGIKPYDPNDVFWKTKTLIFQNMDLAQVFDTLERHYNVKITTSNDQILDCRLTAKFYGEDIDQIFEIISTNFNLTTQIEDDHFIISGPGCH